MSQSDYETRFILTTVHLSTSSHANTILHTGENFGDYVENQMGEYWNFSSLHYSANSWHGLNLEILGFAH